MKWNNVVPTENDLKENSAKLQSTFAGKHNFSIWCSFQMHYYICKKKTLTHTHANSIHRAYIEHTPKYHSLAQNQQKFYLKFSWCAPTSLRFAQIQTMPISKPFSNTSFPIVYYTVRRCSTLCTQRLLWPFGQCDKCEGWVRGRAEQNEEIYSKNNTETIGESI